MRLLGMALVVALAGAGAEAAEPSRPPLIVLDLDSRWAAPLQGEAATQGVVRGLRELDVFQVLSSADVRQLLALERTRQLVGAEGGAVKELAQALGARHAVTGSVAQQGAGLVVEIRLLDTGEQQVLAQKTLGPVAGVEQMAAQLPALAQALVSPLLQAQQGTLLVKTQEEAAELWVDEVLVGSTPLAAPLKLPRGAHRVQVRKDGFIAQARTVRIAPEQLTEEAFTLLPSADYAEAYRLRHGRLRVGAYLFTGAAVLGLGGALALDRLVTEPTYQRQFLPRKMVADGVVESRLPAQLRGDAELLQTYRECGADEDACRRELEGLRGQLIGAQVATVGLGVVGVLATGAASYLWLTGQDPNRYSGLVATVSPGPEPRFVLAGRF